MEVYVKSPNFRRFSLFPEGSLVGDVLANLVQLQVSEIHSKQYSKKIAEMDV